MKPFDALVYCLGCVPSSCPVFLGQDQDYSKSYCVLNHFVTCALHGLWQDMDLSLGGGGGGVNLWKKFLCEIDFH